MSYHQRTILIIEDEPLLNEAFSLICGSVAHELAEEQAEIGLRVLQAHSLHETLALLDANSTIDVVSIDLVLRDDERNLGEAERRMGHEVSGIVVLRQLRTRPHRPLSLIVSGETLPTHTRATLHIYGVLQFYEKSRIDFEHYKDAIKAALYYLEAADRVAELEGQIVDPSHVMAAYSYWERAARAVKAAGFDERGLPSDIAARIKALKVQR